MLTNYFKVLLSFFFYRYQYWYFIAIVIIIIIIVIIIVFIIITFAFTFTFTSTFVEQKFCCHKFLFSVDSLTLASNFEFLGNERIRD